MLENNVFRLMILMGGVIALIAIITLCADGIPEVEDVFQHFISHKNTKY
ncbi:MULTISPECIES: hypothetical protein [Bacillus]|nr:MULTISPECIES: hypothetical protein [Bacillus]EJV73129.1 hypothetical protein IG1_05878 [Bacillus cereus HD73]EOO04869.1 hypothetical protein IAW_05876 [Bacillus cereus str. Schrouff]EOO43549.1 hypothetical protein ICK_06847 [Bacillus cereus BAG1X2-2]EOO81049.1 hypothetical protein IGY_06061 [Bacillus cereus K-5975c]MCU5706021.1 hypothetical protein [Bacillus wiedmannii]